MSMSVPLIEAVNLTKRYQVGGEIISAVAQVSLEIKAGEFVAIVGRSGSGKSTLLSLLGLLERFTEGEYRLNGRDVAGLREDARADLRRRQIGFVFQMPSLLARYSTLENVELPLAYAGLSPSDRRVRAEAALETVGLIDRMNHWPHQLSGGEQQRAAIARALVNDPTLILADEPTGSVDSRTADVILSLFEELYQAGRTILLITHAPDVAARAPRQIVMHDGRVLADRAVAVEQWHDFRRKRVQ